MISTSIALYNINDLRVSGVRRVAGVQRAKALYSVVN